MRKMRKYFALFVLMLASLVILTLFKPEITGYSVASTSKAGSLFTIVFGVFALSALVLISLMTFRPVVNDHLNNHQKQEVKELSRIKDYVSSRRKDGYSDVEIRDALVDYQWDNHMIDFALNEADIDGRKIR